MASPDIRLATARPQEDGLVHPCEFIQRSGRQQEEVYRMNQIRTTHGIGAAMDVAMTETTLLGSRRLGALPTSNTLYNAYRGGVTELRPEDVYGLPENDPCVQPSSRALAERQMYGYELTMKNMGM